MPRHATGTGLSRAAQAPPPGHKAARLLHRLQVLNLEWKVQDYAFLSRNKVIPILMSLASASSAYAPHDSSALHTKDTLLPERIVNGVLSVADSAKRTIEINPLDRLTVKWVFNRGTAISEECWYQSPCAECPAPPPYYYYEVRLRARPCVCAARARMCMCAHRKSPGMASASHSMSLA